MLASLFCTRCDRRIIITANCWRVLVSPTDNLNTKQLGGIATDYCQAENNVVYFIYATKQATTGDNLSCLNNFSSATPPDTEDTCKEHLGRHC
ncbi:hypothetical protein T4E_6131 [Trichinella pseudospiralis]|uniref:Uncharacterized protein n=1 Tax=Trichinella pseudospiralis TaxID=6337 RepID=A0A0V0XSJ1_TRIPS|nr:hypothetical protein T4E_6131 [Trichinella pseudospiralis]